MLTLSQMVIRLVIALLLGGLMGFERERIGKEAGIRTSMLVAAGASIFSMISFEIPALLGIAAEGATSLPDRVISNVVVGIGFLGAGIIIQTGERVRGLTTAALVWTVAAIGVLVGIGLIKFAAVAAVITSGTLFITRLFDIQEKIRPPQDK